MASIDWRPLSEPSGFAERDPWQDIAASRDRPQTSRRMKQRLGHWVATCAMGAWALLAIVPVIVVLMAIDG
ncbi:hypothetical protein [Gluconacetobacter diazotrophicus]|uniref:Putative membrane protein n=1 Tax=Gluconacetobacter diazotrophicus (strain ATCC 49037 / DSM 5601 / CCUG 37298 / CIP 103539 / LMG 7603 / PAl5) TaxID=272568 RepID=A9HLU6_GLUDA|nr:hypothetical protein [Gluconacetobacter diazotrophicus]CAP56214.1 putative membrane protein [Gluconacetobacter diazotrophicus PA1 5]